MWISDSHQEIRIMYKEFYWFKIPLSILLTSVWWLHSTHLLDSYLLCWIYMQIFKNDEKSQLQKLCISGKCPVRANADHSLDLTARRGRTRCDECLWFYVLLSRSDPQQHEEEGPFYLFIYSFFFFWVRSFRMFLKRQRKRAASSSFLYVWSEEFKAYTARQEATEVQVYI